MVISISGSSYGCSDGNDIGDTLRRDTLRAYERTAFQMPEHRPDGPLPAHVPLPCTRLNRPVPLAMVFLRSRRSNTLRLPRLRHFGSGTRFWEANRSGQQPRFGIWRGIARSLSVSLTVDHIVHPSPPMNKALERAIGTNRVEAASLDSAGRAFTRLGS